MKMDLRSPDTWISHLLEVLPEEKLSAPVKEDNPDWEYIDGEIVKLGSLAHSQLDIAELQRRGLTLLASETKDFRLFAHLLRTLQHAGDVLLAVRLLTLYVEHFWANSAPQNMAHKKRFAAQVLKRFEAGATGVAEHLLSPQREELLGALAKLAQCWQALGAAELAQAADDVSAHFRRGFQDSAPDASASTKQIPAMAASAKLSESTPAPVSLPQIVINSHDDKGWRDTLLNVAAILCERQPDLPLGYRLRRQALWQTITITPQAESDGRTPLSAVSSDMAAEYRERINHADTALWQQVEKSLLLAPYWLDGQHISAQIALQLGFEDAAQAIRDETLRFYTRLPHLATLLFNDRTPFMAEKTKQWLTSPSGERAESFAPSDGMLSEAKMRFTEEGLESALKHLDSTPQGDPRGRFYRQYFAAQLMEEAGMKQLARQQFTLLLSTAQHTSLAEWEPSLLDQLERSIQE